MHSKIARRNSVMDQWKKNSCPLRCWRYVPIRTSSKIYTPHFCCPSQDAPTTRSRSSKSERPCSGLMMEEQRLKKVAASKKTKNMKETAAKKTNQMKRRNNALITIATGETKRAKKKNSTRKEIPSKSLGSFAMKCSDKKLTDVEWVRAFVNCSLEWNCSPQHPLWVCVHPEGQDCWHSNHTPCEQTPKWNLVPTTELGRT